MASDKEPVDSGKIELKPAAEMTLEELKAKHPPLKKKTGNKPKELKEGTFMGIEIGVGETRRIIDPEEVFNYASIGCSIEECASMLKVSYTTFNDNFREVYDSGRNSMKQKLRRAQLDLAVNGNSTMQVFLGKNILGQSDSNASADISQPLPWSDD